MITIDTHSYFYNKKKKPQTNSSSGGGVSVTTVEHGTSNTNTTISPNTLHKWDEVAELTLALGAETPGIVNEYLIQFTSGATPTIVTLPEDVKWASPLKIKANRIYQISIVNNLAVYAEFSALSTPQIILDLTATDVAPTDTGLCIINPDMINQLQPLCAWFVAAAHTGEDIDNKLIELGAPVPEEMMNTVPGVVCDEGFLIINFPPEDGLPELVYGFGIKLSALNPEAPENMCYLIPNDFMNYPIETILDLNTGDLMLYMGVPV